MDVRQEQRHGAAFGDFPGFVHVALRALGAGACAGQKPQPGAGEQAKGKVLLLTGAAEAVHGVVDFRFQILDYGLFEDRRVKTGAAQGEVVEGDFEERSELPFLVKIHYHQRAFLNFSADSNQIVRS